MPIYALFIREKTLGARRGCKTSAGWAVFGVALVTIAVVTSLFAAEDAGDSATRNTIRLSLAWYAVALVLMMRLEPADWRPATRIGQAARWCWTWACVCFWVHLLVAFHYFHHWSHWHAFEHTRQVSGVGEGLYVSYLFTLLWTADVVWWWFAPQRYSNRSPWIDRSLHSFMLLIVLNGTVVFESGRIRWASLAALAALASLFLARARGQFQTRLARKQHPTAITHNTTLAGSGTANESADAPL